MPSITDTTAYNAATLGSLSAVPVAVFVGGTSGTGRGAAEALAKHTKGNAHIIIIGRNRKAAEEIIASFPTPTAPGAKHEFVECDVSLLKNVRATTADLVARLPAINYLVLSCASVTVPPGTKTADGLNGMLATSTYPRWKFTYELLPLLKKASPAPARVLQIGGAGLGNGCPIPLHDLGQEGEYDPETRRSLFCQYGDVWAETFGNRYPAISFVYSNPGVVDTPLLRDLLKMQNIEAPPGTLQYDEAGEYQLYALLQGKPGAAWKSGEGDALPRPKDEEVRQEVQDGMWTYMMKSLKLEA